MRDAFEVTTTRAFDRSMKRLAKSDVRISVLFERLLAVLSNDPYNTSRRYDITKLTDVDQGDGQWRIRTGVYRLRYDIEGRNVILHSINHRREAY